MIYIKKLKNTMLQLFLWLVLMLAIMTPLIWISFTYPDQFQNLSHSISQNKLFFTALRWLMIITIFCAWPRFIRRWAKYHYWKPEKIMFWLNQRLKITLWLALFELIICENLLLTLIHLLESH